MIVIKELLPNPLGEDAQGEWIRLINTSELAINPSELSLKDESGKIFSLKSISNIAQGEVVELNRSLTGIALNNDGDTVYLLDASGEVVDKLSYQSSVSEEEIVTADNFVTQAPLKPSLQGNMLELGRIDYRPGITPTIAGLLIATISSLIIWSVVKNIFQNENQ